LLAAGLASLPCNAEFRDPTQPAYPLPSTIKAEMDSNLVLSAIWISPRSKRATINGISVKQGQTIVIEHTPALKPALPASANSVVINDKKNEPLDKAMQHTDSDTAISNPLEEHAIPAKQQLNAAYTETAHIPEHSTKIKIISIYKNSVIISQNGELKTLQLVQRPYKTR
jgi:hypothetical protein